MADSTWFRRACIVGTRTARDQHGGDRTLAVRAVDRARVRGDRHHLHRSLRQPDAAGPEPGGHRLRLPWVHRHERVEQRADRRPHQRLETALRDHHHLRHGIFASETSLSEDSCAPGIRARRRRGEAWARSGWPPPGHTRGSTTASTWACGAGWCRRTPAPWSGEDAGCVELFLNYQAEEPNQVQIFSHWANLMGDPALEVWTGVPGSSRWATRSACRAGRRRCP